MIQIVIRHIVEDVVLVMVQGNVQNMLQDLVELPSDRNIPKFLIIN